jgi:hypothetical protein
MNYAYTYAGLHIHSTIEIPEWAGFERADSDDAEVHIDLENGSQGWETPAPDAPVVRADVYHFSVPEVGAYRVLDGREIWVAPNPAAGWREVRLFMLGSAWSALCYQRDLLVLHASVVRIKADAVAFCAHPGMGKSTLAAYLTEAGHTLVSDDLTRLELPAQGSPLIYPSARRLKLWQDALDALDWGSAVMERDHYRCEKFHLPLDGNGEVQPLPLRAIYILEWGELGLTRLTGQAALQGLVRAATYRAQLLQPMGKLGWYYRQCLALIQRIPVWQFQRPRDLERMDQAVHYLREHWRKQETT